METEKEKQTEKEGVDDAEKSALHIDDDLRDVYKSGLQSAQIVYGDKDLQPQVLLWRSAACVYAHVEHRRDKAIPAVCKLLVFDHGEIPDSRIGLWNHLVEEHPAENCDELLARALDTLGIKNTF